MNDIEIVRRKSVIYTDVGQTDSTDESYIKISTSFRYGTLRQLQGAPLSAFLDVALHEADEPPGVTLERISDETGVSYRHLLRIMPQLCNASYCAISGVDARGNQIYRVSAYAWFGKEKPQHKDTQSITATSHSGNGKRSYDKMSHDNGTVVDVVKLNQNDISRQQQTTRTREILRECGIFGKPLNVLSESVSPETAQAWRDWLKSPPSYLRNPIGVVVNALLADSESRPTVRENKVITPRVRKPTITGKLARKVDDDDQNTD